MNLPGAELEIEIMLSIPLRGSWLRAGFRCVRILLCAPLKWLQHDNQAEHHEQGLNPFDVHHCLLLTPLSIRLSVAASSAALLRSFPREIDLPVFAPGFAAIRGAMTFPVRSPICDVRPGEPREKLASSLVLPLAMKLDRATFKSSAPDQEATRRRCVRPRMLPLGCLRIEGAEAETFDDRSLVRPLKEFQRNAVVQHLRCRQRAGALIPGSIGQGKAADGVPLAFEKIKLLSVCDRCRGTHSAHIDLHTDFM